MEIIRGVIPCAKKVVIYGPEGIGKSTFASKFPDPVFIDTEGSTNSMDVARLPKASSWQMLLDQVDYVRTHPTMCKTLVIDTIDWAESMCIRHICDKHRKSGIEDFGYGNGYVYVKEELGKFLNQLTEVVDAGVNVVLTAHAQIRKFEQPDELGAYDRWELKLGKKTASQTSPLIKEWADMLLFAGGKPVFYEPPELKAARQKLVAYLGQHVPDEPYHCGVRLITKWCFPRGKHLDGTYRLSKPDTDNLQKLLKDCMTKVGFWDDDALVASEIVEKFWAEVPGIYVRIDRLP